MHYDNINNLFKESGLSIAEISRETNISYSTVYNYINNNVESPNEKYFKPIYDLLQSNCEESNITKQENITQSQQDNIIRPVYTGDICFIKNDNSVGSEFKGDHYAIVLGNGSLNKNSKFIKIVYLTTKEKSVMPTHVKINTKGRTVTALCEQIHTVDKSRIIRFAGRISDHELEMINEALIFSLGLNMKKSYNNSNEIELLKLEKNLYKKFYEDIMHYKHNDF